MIDFDSDAKLNQIGACYVVNNLERNQTTEEIVERMVFDRLRAQLANLLSRDAMRKTEEVYSTRYEVRLYVLTSDQLEKYVQRRAMQLGYTPRAAITEVAYEAEIQQSS